MTSLVNDVLVCAEDTPVNVRRQWEIGCSYRGGIVWDVMPWLSTFRRSVMPSYSELVHEKVTSSQSFVNKKEKWPCLLISVRFFFFCIAPRFLNTLRTGDADLRFYITTVQDG